MVVLMKMALKVFFLKEYIKLFHIQRRDWKSGGWKKPAECIKNMGS